MTFSPKMFLFKVFNDFVATCLDLIHKVQKCFYNILNNHFIKKLIIFLSKCSLKELNINKLSRITNYNNWNSLCLLNTVGWKFIKFVFLFESISLSVNSLCISTTFCVKQQHFEFTFQATEWPVFLPQALPLLV